MTLDGHGNNPNMVASKFFSLHWAANNSHLEVLLVLLKHGADKNAVVPETEEKPIDLAKTDTIRFALKGKGSYYFD